jgi:hypothetical protein
MRDHRITAPSSAIFGDREFGKTPARSMGRHHAPSQPNAYLRATLQNR